MLATSIGRKDKILVPILTIFVTDPTAVTDTTFSCFDSRYLKYLSVLMFHNWHHYSHAGV